MQREATEAKRAHQAALAELEALRPLKEKAGTLEAQIAEARAAQEDLDGLLRVLRQNPALEAQVLELLGLPANALGARRAMPARPGDPPRTSGLSPDVETQLRQVLDFAKQQQTNAEVAEERAAQESFNARAIPEVQRYLAERDFRPDQVLDQRTGYTVLHDVLDFVAEQATRTGLQRIEDLPHLLNRWFIRAHGLAAARTGGYVAAKVNDAAQVPPPVPGGTPVSIGEKPLSISHPDFNKRVLESWRAMRGQSAA